ncbi:1-acyl-sn-glycerol-3-phosphate acyltransferase [Sesbania bispinosa]|nr:1-acyl-sn-glycerol-3-phosphate acyltransferase [Sesbania bispinosa]
MPEFAIITRTTQEIEKRKLTTKIEQNRENHNTTRINQKLLKRRYELLQEDEDEDTNQECKTTLSFIRVAQQSSPKGALIPCEK